jgi:hypothetical protein
MYASQRRTAGLAHYAGVLLPVHFSTSEKSILSKVFAVMIGPGIVIAATYVIGPALPR